jgi:hypothetical protein
MSSRIQSLLDFDGSIVNNITTATNTVGTPTIVGILINIYINNILLI